MTRNLKALGLALVAVFALTAVGASAASAAEFHSEATETVLTGSQIGTDVFETNGGTVECSEATYVGEQSGTTTTTATVTPTYSGCTAFGFGGASVNTNGCEYEFHSNGTVDIQSCNTAAGVIVTASLFGTRKCTVEVPEQAGVSGVTFTSSGAGTTRDITVDVAITSLHYIQTAGTGFGACASGTATNGKYNGSTTVTGEDALGVHKGIWYA